jgi:putative transposase
VRLAKEQGLSLTGPGGLLKQLTETVRETALNEEMTERAGLRHRARYAGARKIRAGLRRVVPPTP